MRWFLLLILILALPACTLHVVAPEPDIRTLEAVAPAAEASSLAAVTRLPLTELATLIERHAMEPVVQQGVQGPLRWSVDIRRSGLVLARADNGALCLLVPFAVVASADMLGAAIRKNLAASVDVCARPVLGQDASLSLTGAQVRVRLEDANWPGPLRMLSDVAIEPLQNRISTELSRLVGGVSLPLGPAIAPLLVGLRRPIALQQEACLKLRPQEVATSQPEVDPTALRLAVAISAQPTVEQPCVAEAPPVSMRAGPAATPAPLPIVVRRELHQPETRLLLPLGVSLETLRLEAEKQLVTGKPIVLSDSGKPGTDNGWIQLDALRLDSAKGALLMRVKMHGEIRDTLLWWPISRAMEGEFLIWGVPEVTETEIRLKDVQLDLKTDDRLMSVGMALERANLTQKIADKLRIPRVQVESQARTLVTALGRPIQVGTQQWPVRVDVRQLAVEQVRAVGQRLEVLVRFAGMVVIGATDRL